MEKANWALEGWEEVNSQKSLQKNCIREAIKHKTRVRGNKKESEEPIVQKDWKDSEHK